MSSNLDDRGRVVLPKRLRDRFGLGPGSRIEIEESEDGIIVRPERDVDDVLGRFRGAIHHGNRDPKVEDSDPHEVKKIWEPKK